MKKKKICIVALSRFETPSGICRYAFNLAQIISKIPNTEVFFVIGKWQAHYFENSFQINTLGININIIDISNSSINRNIWFFIGLPILTRKIKAKYLFLTFPIPIFKFLFNKLKIITSVHDLYAFEFPENFKMPFFNRLFTIISIRNANKVSSLSNVTTKKINKYFPESSNKVITNYTPFAYSPIIENYNIVNASNEYILTVAQHRKNKNLDILIQAYGVYKKQTKSKLKLIIVGSNGPETNNLLNLTKELYLEMDISFKHGVSDEDLKKYYLNCKCFFLLSSTEGLGLPLIESLYYSKSIICSDIEVFREVDEENCNFVELENNPIGQIVDYLRDGYKPNFKFGLQDNRFDIQTIRKNYESLINEENIQ